MLTRTWSRMVERQLHADAGRIGKEQLRLVQLVHDVGFVFDARGIEAGARAFQVVAVERKVVEHARRLHAVTADPRDRQMHHGAITGVQPVTARSRAKHWPVTFTQTDDVDVEPAQALDGFGRGAQVDVAESVHRHAAQSWYEP